MPEFDFAALSQALCDASVQDAAEPTVAWVCAYPKAIAKAIDLDDFGELRRLLQAGERVPPSLQPAVAYALSPARTKRSGPKFSMTRLEADWLKYGIDEAVRRGTPRDVAYDDHAEAWGVSKSTVKRLTHVPRRGLEPPR